MGMNHPPHGNTQDSAANFPDRVKAGEFVVCGYDQHGFPLYVAANALAKPFQWSEPTLSLTLHAIVRAKGGSRA